MAGSVTRQKTSSISSGRLRWPPRRDGGAGGLRKLGGTEQTYYRWRKKYGGPSRDQAKRRRELEQENARLKKLVADISLDNAILKEAAQGNY